MGKEEELGMFIIITREREFIILKRIILYPSRIILKLILIFVEKSFGWGNVAFKLNENAGKLELN